MEGKNTVGKIIEITASSPESFEDAIRRGIERASATISEVQGAWVEQQKVVVQGGEVKEFRVFMKVTFVLRDAR